MYRLSFPLIAVDFVLVLSLASFSTIFIVIFLIPSLERLATTFSDFVEIKGVGEEFEISQAVVKEFPKYVSFSTKACFVSLPALGEPLQTVEVAVFTMEVSVFTVEVSLLTVEESLIAVDASGFILVIGGILLFKVGVFAVWIFGVALFLPLLFDDLEDCGLPCFLDKGVLS